MNMINKIRRYLNLRKAKRRAILLGQMIDSIDKAFASKNISRSERRRFWRDFIASPERRNNFIKEMKL